ncbi:MAG TPA: hypothetical protein VN661_03340 [Candidatus Acidoferrales bacterium]|nr:hypothetical protein [Candidatus Acidoferrales bacterium]
MSLLMKQGGVMEKGAQLGTATFSNYGVPLLTVCVAVMVGAFFALLNMFVGIVAFGAILFAGFKVRTYLKGRTRSNFADLSEDIKRDGFRCNRCEHMFIPAGATTT